MVAKCKSCDCKIGQLNYEVTDTYAGHFTKRGKYTDLWCKAEDALIFMCPHCGVHLFDNENDAYDFLNP
jgi:hypothetical protein